MTARAMFENFTRTEIKTSGARIVTVHGGKGPPLLLMHGNPFSHLSWHKFAPRLAGPHRQAGEMGLHRDRGRLMSRPPPRPSEATRQPPARRRPPNPPTSAA